jgi:hypothetical protein
MRFCGHGVVFRLATGDSSFDRTIAFIEGYGWLHAPGKDPVVVRLYESGEDLLAPIDDWAAVRAEAQEAVRQFLSARKMPTHGTRYGSPFLADAGVRLGICKGSRDPERRSDPAPSRSLPPRLDGLLRLPVFERTADAGEGARKGRGRPSSPRSRGPRLDGVPRPFLLERFTLEEDTSLSGSAAEGACAPPTSPRPEDRVDIVDAVACKPPRTGREITR